MKLQIALDDFVLTLTANLRSEKTIKWYVSMLGAAFQYLDCELESVTTKQLRLYIASLRSQTTRYKDAKQKPQQDGKLSDDTVAGHIRALHSFWAWAAKEYKISNPMNGIARPKPAKPKPKAAAESDFVKLFNATLDNPLGARDRAILAVFYDTGCRLQGLLSLQFDNIDLENRRCYFQEKGGDNRVAPYSEYTDVLLKHWLMVRDVESQYIFTTETGTPITESGLHQILKRLKKRAGVKGRTNPHSFRHAYAKGYLKNGGNLSTLSELMGHADIRVTQDSYAVYADEELVEAHKKHSPLKRLFDAGKKRTENS